jgi:hypothetical protein
VRLESILLVALVVGCSPRVVADDTADSDVGAADPCQDGTTTRLEDGATMASVDTTFEELVGEVGRLQCTERGSDGGGGRVEARKFPDFAVVESSYEAPDGECIWSYGAFLEFCFDVPSLRGCTPRSVAVVVEDGGLALETLYDYGGGDIEGPMADFLAATDGKLWLDLVYVREVDDVSTGVADISLQAEPADGPWELADIDCAAGAP